MCSNSYCALFRHLSWQNFAYFLKYVSNFAKKADKKSHQNQFEQ